MSLQIGASIDSSAFEAQGKLHRTCLMCFFALTTRQPIVCTDGLRLQLRRPRGTTSQTGLAPTTAILAPDASPDYTTRCQRLGPTTSKRVNSAQQRIQAPSDAQRPDSNPLTGQEEAGFNTC
jgi:hypothetical protein